MKKLIAASLFVLSASLCTNHLFAQEIPDRARDSVRNSPGKWSPEKKEQVKASAKKKKDQYADLNLTEAQQAKMAESRKAGMEKIRMVKADSTLSEDQKKARYREIRKEQQSVAGTILTPEQQQQLKQSRKGQARRMRNLPDSKN